MKGRGGFGWVSYDFEKGKSRLSGGSDQGRKPAKTKK